jgi:hypothetical protein
LVLWDVSVLVKNQLYSGPGFPVIKVQNFGQKSFFLGTGLATLPETQHEQLLISHLTHSFHRITHWPL